MFKIAKYVAMALKHLLRNILKAAHYFLAYLQKSYLMHELVQQILSRLA